MPAHRQTYLDIADDLAERINRGEYPPGTWLPTYTALARMYSVSTATVQRALLVLRTQGVVIGYQGKGSYVARQET